MSFLDFMMVHGFSILVCFFLGALGLAIVIKVFNGTIDLRYLVSESNHQASMSRLQLLIFTFVIAVGLFKLIDGGKQFPEIPNGVLTLLGISASTYAVSKGISYSQPDTLKAPPEDDGSGTSATAAAASADLAQQAAAEAAGHAERAKASAVQASAQTLVQKATIDQLGKNG